MSEGEDEQRDLEPSVASERVDYGRPPIRPRFRPGHSGNPRLRAAGVVFAALAIQEYRGCIVFDLLALPLLRAETAVVGTLVQAARPGTVWQDNVITGPSGFGIAAYSDCSLFHNLSLAMLCWLTVSRPRNQSGWSRGLVTGCVIGATMIACNVKRLCLGLEP
jgi:hypothetical protein